MSGWRPLQGFEERLRRLEDQLGRMQADRSRKGDISAEESQGQEDRLGRTALESKISTMEQRLAGLEDDPVRRGYAFLASESDELRREGVNILKRVARFDPEARAAIRKLLRDPSARVREQTAQVLRDLRDKESAPEMMGLLADSDASIRRRAVQALTAIDAGEAIPGLADRLTSDQDDRVRVSAADGLGKLKASQATEPLLKALKDQSEAVRREAISSLGEVGAKEAAPYLRAMYDQDPGANRMQLVLALKALGDEAPLEKEVQRLSQMVEKNADAGARRQAIRELAVLSRDSPSKSSRRRYLIRARWSAERQRGHWGGDQGPFPGEARPFQVIPAQLPGVSVLHRLCELVRRRRPRAVIILLRVAGGPADAAVRAPLEPDGQHPLAERHALTHLERDVGRVHLVASPTAAALLARHMQVVEVAVAITEAGPGPGSSLGGELGRVALEAECVMRWIPGLIEVWRVGFAEEVGVRGRVRGMAAAAVARADRAVYESRGTEQLRQVC
jgi:HEAT repeat protein